MPTAPGGLMARANGWPADKPPVPMRAQANSKFPFHAEVQKRQSSHIIEHVTHSSKHKKIFDELSKTLYNPLKTLSYSRVCISSGMPMLCLFCEYRHRAPSGGTRLEQADDADKSERAEQERLQHVALRHRSRRLDHQRLHRNHPCAILSRSVRG